MDDTAKKYLFYAGLARSQQLKPLNLISKLITILTLFIPRTALQFVVNNISQITMYPSVQFFSIAGDKKKR